VAARAYGAQRWAAATDALHTRLESAHQPHHVQRYSTDELRDLPAPVQRYFRTVLREGQPIITAATITHTGTFNMSETGEQWRPFTSSQQVTTQRLGFAVPPAIQLHTYREALFIFYGKVTVYLQALGKPMPPQWATWIG
jgi:hypothetical protein